MYKEVGNTSEKRLIINQPDFWVYEYEFDPLRKHWYCLCEELIDGRWEGFISIRKTGTNKKYLKTKTDDKS
ncbi:MAG: hypothetical protein D4R97_04490 [Bacteroidetes bacterium]|nr:MAG: hypothetical protein D4R97_04490 [Bacteroidota bacterium]